MKISFSTAGRPAIIMSKEAAEAALRKYMEPTRVDLLLLNVMAGRPMVYSHGGKPPIVIKAIDFEANELP